MIASLAALHELENLKLVHRAVRRAIAATRWTRWWRPLGSIEELRLSELRLVRTAGDLIDRTSRTSYAELVETIVSRDTADAELAIDRWGSRRIVKAARDLPRRDREAASLALDLVRERDLDLLARADVWELDRRLALQRCALLPEELDEVVDPARRRDAIRDDRLDRCRRAFLGPPLTLVPAVALLLIEEALLAELVAIAEAPC